MKNDTRDSIRLGMWGRFFAVWLFLLFALAMAPGLWAQNCGAPENPVVAENCNPGNPPSEWDVSGIGDSSIQGFTTDISVNQGGTVLFKINTNVASLGLPDPISRITSPSNRVPLRPRSYFSTLLPCS